MTIRLIIAAIFFTTAALAANPGGNRVLGLTEGGTGTANGPAAVPFTASGATSAATALARAGHNLNAIDDFGAKGGGKKSNFLVTCAQGGRAVTLNWVNANTLSDEQKAFVASYFSPTLYPAFSAADVGKVIDLPGCGATYTLREVYLAAAGTGYRVGDVLTVPDGAGTAARLIVLRTNAGGAVDQLAIEDVGAYSVPPSGTLTAPSSTGGSGVQFTLTFQNILATTIQSVSAYNTLTVATEAGASQTAAPQNVTWGWDDTAAIQTALNSCRYLQLANETYLVEKLIFPTCATTAMGISAGGLIGNVQSTLIAIAGADNGFLAATSHWASNVGWDDAPYFVSNVTFDANNIALDAVDDMSYQSRYTMTNFTNALRFGHKMAGYTRNYVTTGNTNVGQQIFTDANASYNRSDGFHGDPNGVLANGVVSKPATDFKYIGGGAYRNGGFGRSLGSTAGMLMQSVHDWGNRPSGGMPSNGASGPDLRVDGYGYGSTVAGNVLEGGAIIDSLGVSKVGVFGPGNQMSGDLVYNGKDGNQGTLTSMGNVFYTCDAGIYNGYNGLNAILVSSGDFLQCSRFTGSGSGWQIWAKDVSVYYNAQQGQSYRCTLNGYIRNSGSGAHPCTDFEVPKTAAAGATSLTFTITATGQQAWSLRGGGFHMLGQLEASAYSGGVMETYRADVAASFAYATGTTAVAHKAAISNAQSSAATPTITASATCADTSVSTSSNYVETCVVTVNFPAAAEAYRTNVRFKAHFDYDQITALTVQ